VRVKVNESLLEASKELHRNAGMIQFHRVLREEMKVTKAPSRESKVNVGLEIIKTSSNHSKVELPTGKSGTRVVKNAIHPIQSWHGLILSFVHRPSAKFTDPKRSISNTTVHLKRNEWEIHPT
jgi:hypothetical protein